jgi:Fe-S-cluster-containing hydrogenase component 2
MKRLCVQPDICSGCRACVVACVAYHKGRFGTAAARVRVTKVESRGLDLPHVCHLCRSAPCAAACPADALRVDPMTGAVLLNAVLCTACGECAAACPFDMVILDTSTGRPLICDLCGGDPSCVKRCATGAIRYGMEGLDRRSESHE